MIIPYIAENKNMFETTNQINSINPTNGVVTSKITIWTIDHIVREKTRPFRSLISARKTTNNGSSKSNQIGLAWFGH
jgi:hypothetical protein